MNDWIREEKKEVKTKIRIVQLELWLQHWVIGAITKGAQEICFLLDLKIIKTKEASNPLKFYTFCAISGGCTSVIHGRIQAEDYSE